MLRFIMIAATSAWACLSPCAASAQGYPERPIRLIVPAAAGLGADISARLFANQLQTLLPQPVFVENRPGASGEIAAGEAVRATPDGYTLFFGSTSVLAGNKWLFQRNFDTTRDLEPIIAGIGTPLVLLAGSRLKGLALKDVIAAAKQTSTLFALGSAATINSVAYGMLRHAAAIDIQLVPYRSNQQAYVDLLSGDIQLMFDGVMPATPYINDGKVTGLAVTAQQRSRFLPNIPTFRESGYDVELYGWAALLGPKGLPPKIVEILNRAGNEALQNAELRKRLATIGADAMGGTPEDLRKLIAQDEARWGEIIQKFKLK